MPVYFSHRGKNANFVHRDGATKLWTLKKSKLLWRTLKPSGLLVLYTCGMYKVIKLKVVLSMKDDGWALHRNHLPK